MLTEQQEQIKVVNYLSILERQGKIITYFAVPNGGTRNKIEATGLKKEGARAGVSDLIIVLKEKVLFLEMKRSPNVLKSGKLSYLNSKISDAQVKFLETVKQNKNCVSNVAYGFADARSKIDCLL